MNPEFLKKSKLSLLRLFEPKMTKMTIFGHFDTPSIFDAGLRPLPDTSPPNECQKC